MARISITFSNNVDTGSLPVGNQLPEQFRKHGLKPQGLQVQLQGEEKPRTISYVMGSEKKGWHLCAKGAGKFPTDGQAELIVAE